MNPLSVTRMSGFGQGKPSVFERSPVSLGTAPGNDLKFDPSWDKTVSDRHAYIEWKDGRWMVTDAGSREGTLVNGRRINGPVPVGAGVEIELGTGGPRVKLADPAWDRMETRAREEITGALAGEEARRKGKTASAGAASGRSKALAAVAALVFLGLIGGLSWFFWQQNRESADAAKRALATATDATKAATNASKAAADAAAKAKEASEREIPKDIDDQFIEVAKAHENCVGLVVLSGQSVEGEPITVPMATAWAVGEAVFATNSHVTEPVKEHLAGGGAAFVVINKNPDLRFRVAEAVVHPKYGGRHLNVDGKDPAVPAYDVGLLRVEGKVPNHLKIASETDLETLDSGYRVAYMGFPMEGIAGGGVDYRSPVATMQSGIVTSNSDYWLSKAPYHERLLVSHNLGATGGSSGSPVFNSRGEVVAILSAGNIVAQVKIVDGRIGVARAPSGVLINYAQRIDLLRDIYPEYDQALAR